jgi:5-methylcytosine-specific restriction endonuclease McrA
MPIIPAEGAACRVCGEWRPQDHYYVRNQQTGNRAGECKLCHNTQVMGHPPNKWRKDQRATEKQCAGCEQVLPIDSFALKNANTGLRRAYCRSCHNAKSVEFKAANREHVRAQNRGYYAANPEVAKERQRIYREKYSAIHNGWKRQNPDARRAHANKRRVLVEQAGPHYTAVEWKAMKVRYDHRCLMCRRQEPTIRLTVDHIVPISQGGLNTIDNIQPLCKSCNSKKHRGIIDLRPLTQAALQLE